MARMMTGAALRGAPMAMPAGGTPTGADLQRGPSMMAGDGPDAEPDADPDDQGAPAGGDLDQAIAQVLQAAQAQGFRLPQGGVPPDQLPQVYDQILKAAAQNPDMQTDGGIALIERLAKSLGLPSPYGQQDPNAPDYALGGEEPTAIPSARNMTPVPPGFNPRR